MKRLLLLFSMVLLTPSVAWATQVVDGVIVTDLGIPACYQPNPVPDRVQGTLFERLPELNGATYGSTSPYDFFHASYLRGATWSALGSPIDPTTGSPVPTRVAYFFSTPQTSVTLLWGTMDGNGTPEFGNILVFLQVAPDGRSQKSVAAVNGGDLRKAFPGGTAYVKFTVPAGKSFNKLVFFDYTGPSTYFEYGNMNATCNAGAAAVAPMWHRSWWPGRFFNEDTFKD